MTRRAAVQQADIARALRAIKAAEKLSSEQDDDKPRRTSLSGAAGVRKMKGKSNA